MNDMIQSKDGIKDRFFNPTVQVVLRITSLRLLNSPITENFKMLIRCKSVG
jgi:hypothetical protein